MSANLITGGSIYECKLHNKWVQIWVQTWSQVGPNMSANLITRGSKYECKLFWEGPNMSANIEMLLLTRFVQKWGLENPSAIFEFALIFGPSFWCLQSYLDPLMFELALIFGPFYDEVCTHIWTNLWSSLHSYMDRPVMKFALIYGPSYDQACTHIWTHLL